MADPARRKPIPAPIARASVLRPVRPARFVGMLPTAAALLAATATLACQRDPLVITQDPTEGAPRPRLVAESGTKSIDPVDPLPGMAALDPPPAVPEPPKPSPPVPPAPPKKPPAVRGRIAPVHPTPVAPGGLRPLHASSASK